MNNATPTPAACPACGAPARPAGGGRLTCAACGRTWGPAPGDRADPPGEATDLYELLQVSPNADPDVIDAAYRKLAQRYHPDRNGGDEAASRMMVLLNWAKEVLTDPARRAEYDRRRGTPGPAGGSHVPPPAVRPGGSSLRFEVHGNPAVGCLGCGGCLAVFVVPAYLLYLVVRG